MAFFVELQGPGYGEADRISRRLPCVLCFGLKEEKVEQRLFHFILPRSERAASAWDMVDCMKESTCRRDVGGDDGGHWVWEAV
jgi:hypothetical protein